MNRYWQNLVTTRFVLGRAFPQPVLDAIEAAVRESEKRHGAEIQFAIETALEFSDLWRGVTARDEALRAFSELGVWDTERNNGVLIYVLLAERDIEIVADRGYRGRVSDDQWKDICSGMQQAYASDRFLEGSLAGIDAVATILEGEFPRSDDDIDERPNRPHVF